MTWAEFRTAVKELITVDGVRVGVATSPTGSGTPYLTRMTRNGAAEVLSHVEYYSKNNITKYNLAGISGHRPLTTEGNASLGELPGGARPQEAYRLFYDSAEVAASPPTDDEGCNRTPLANYQYTNRNDMICAHPMISKGASLIAIGKAGDFYVYPSLDREEVLEVHWDGFEVSHADADKVPYDEPMAECVAEFVKAKITREVDKDLKLHDSYYASFRKKRQELYINSFGRQALRRNPSGGATSLACAT
ncbi:MAG TPA: hypothetical protein EYN93_02385 [Planctomycetaceae bacterium]|nr:hypothetical protein [Planctomycetaceae bacterium]